MSKTKFTPGPWTATDPHKWLANTPRYKSSIRCGATNLGNSIAEVYLGGPGALNCDAESVNANARLIAAAPDMLEALREIVDDADQSNGGKGAQLPIVLHIRGIAEAAIQKAVKS